MRTSEKPLRRRLAERATFGPSPATRAALRAEGAHGWLERQLRPEGISDVAAELRLEGLETLSLSPERAVAMAPDLKPGRDRAKRRMLQMRLRDMAHEQAAARVIRAVHGERELLEVMTDFWFNHFNVFARKGPVPLVLPQYERDVIRKHALGRFDRLLAATARSPAMLIYLDNVRSTREIGLFRKRGGLNENYARELLELHTLGVDGGYTQEDVVDTARVFTGWSIESRDRPVFRFRKLAHDSGRKTVLGEKVKGGGIDEGIGLLERLARHPSTARHVSTKLARRFVADDPPPPLVERMSRRFLETGGEIAQVLRELFLSPEFADPAHRKLKTPLEFAASAMRASDAETDGGPQTLFALFRLGEAPLHCRPPTGYPDRASDWLDAGAMLERISFSYGFAYGGIQGSSAGVHGPRAEKLALQLASPEFQWQ